MLEVCHMEAEESRFLDVRFFGRLLDVTGISGKHNWNDKLYPVGGFNPSENMSQI